MTWTHPATPIALTPLTVTFWNVNARDNLIHVRGMLPDPGGAGKLHRSSGSETAEWVAAGTAVLDGLGYTPVNRAGDTNMSGAFSGAGDIQWGVSNTRTTVPPSNNLDSISRSGWYFADNAAANTPSPGAFYEVMHVQYPGSAAAFQIASEVSNHDVQFVRNHNTASWSPWRRLHHDGYKGDANTLQGNAAAAFAPVAHTHVDADLTGSINADTLGGVSWLAPKTATQSAKLTVSNTYADAAGLSVTLDRNGKWLILAQIDIFRDPNGSDANPTARLVQGASTALGSPGAINNEADADITVPMFGIATVTGGSDTVKVQGRKSSGSGASYVDLGYLVAVWISP